MTAFGEEQFKRAPGMTPQQEAVLGGPEQVKNPTELWASQAHDVVNKIDSSYQLQETFPGVRFAEDMKQLLNLSIIQSRSQLVALFDTLYNDLTYHEFTIHFETGNIHMANETSIPELGNLFKEFSQQLSQFPVPGFDKELADKRNRLVEAFANRGKNLAG